MPTSDALAVVPPHKLHALTKEGVVIDEGYIPGRVMRNSKINLDMCQQYTASEAEWCTIETIFNRKCPDNFIKASFLILEPD